MSLDDASLRESGLDLHDEIWQTLGLAGKTYLSDL